MTPTPAYKYRHPMNRDPAWRRMELKAMREASEDLARIPPDTARKYRTFTERRKRALQRDLCFRPPMPRPDVTWPLARGFSGLLGPCRAQVLDQHARRARRALDPTRAAGLADHRPMQGRLGRMVRNLQKAFGKFLVDPAVLSQRRFPARQTA